MARSVNIAQVTHRLYYLYLMLNEALDLKYIMVRERNGLVECGYVVEIPSARRHGFVSIQEWFDGQQVAT